MDSSEKTLPHLCPLSNASSGNLFLFKNFIVEKAVKTGHEIYFKN